MSAAAFDAWVKTAATHAAPGGEIIFVHVADRLSALLLSSSGATEQEIAAVRSASPATTTVATHPGTTPAGASPERNA